MARKNPSAVAFGRKSGKNGSAARTGKLTTRKAAQVQGSDTSDETLAALLNRLKSAVDPAEIRKLSDQIERIVFHKQFMNA